MTIAVGLVGFGFSARVLHVPLIQSAQMSIVGVVTRQQAAVREALPGARVLPDMPSLLALERLDLVVIATPNHLHHAQGLAALKQGKHVVIDKPLALTTLEADSLIAAAARHGCKLAVFQNRRWDSDFLTIERIVTQGLLGTLTAFEAHWDRFRPIVADRWREQRQYGGGLLYDLGAHLIDQALCLFGMPDWLQADVFAQRGAAVVDDAFDIRMGKGQVRISLGAGSLVADNALRYRVHGLKASYRKSGVDVQERQLRAGMLPSDAAFGLEPPEQWGQLVQGETGGSEAVAAECGRWREFYASMRRSIEQEDAVPVGASEARRVLTIIEAARHSSDSGQRVTF